MAWKKYFRKQKKRLASWAKKRYTGRGAVRNIVKDVSMLKNMINVEYKYFDYSNSFVPTNAAPVLVSLNDIATGNTSITRTGNSIKAVSFQQWMQIERNPTTASPNANYVRVTILVDKEPLLGTPLVTDIWSSSEPTAFRNYEYEHTKRYTILASRSFVIDGVKVKSAMMKMYKKLRLHMRYSGTGSTTQNNNRLYMIVQTDNTIAGDIAVTTGTRIRYVDN